jgi:hypothetical protein
MGRPNQRMARVGKSVNHVPFYNRIWYGGGNVVKSRDWEKMRGNVCMWEEVFHDFSLFLN